MTMDAMDGIGASHDIQLIRRLPGEPDFLLSFRGHTSIAMSERLGRLYLHLSRNQLSGPTEMRVLDGKGEIVSTFAVPN
jgi:hypothetical protein